MKLLLIDNYDSFTFNLAQYFAELGAEVEVVRNDSLSVTDAMARGDDAIVLSPGPGRPENAGICVELVTAARGRTPLLGVCLGHQAIGVAFGGRVVRASAPMHGKTSTITHDQRGVFAGVANPFEAARYHSLVVERQSMPAELEIAAQTQDEGIVMGLRHREYPVHGVQFHPESVMTRQGMRMLENFLSMEGR